MPYLTMEKARPALERGRAFSRSFVSFLRSRLLLCSFAALFLLGMLIGSLLVGRASEHAQQILQTLLGGYIENRQDQSIAALTLATFSSTFICLLALFFCGFCTISQIIILLIPLFKGLGYGFTLGGLYARYGLEALGYITVLLLPAMLLNTLLLLCASRTAFLLSVRLLRAAIAPSEQNERYRMQRYCLRYVVYLVLCLLIALFDAILYSQLSALFIL